MRVTQNMLAANSLRHISRGYERLEKLEEQLASGKKINRPSDDPVVAMKGMRYRTELLETEQFQRNLSEVYSWMDNSDAALDKVTATLDRIRELTVQASNGTYEESQRGNIASEVDQLISHIESLGNTKVNNKYIFNGSDTTNKPIDLATSKVSSNTKNVSIEVMKGITIDVNVEPQSVFSKELFDNLQELSATLKDPSSKPLDIGKFIETIDSHSNDIVSTRAELGARYNRIEMIETRVSEQAIIAEKILSDNENVDAAKVIIDLKSQESAHRAALAAGARIIQPTLMDFLR